MRVNTNKAPGPEARGLYCGPYALMVLCGLRKPESALDMLRQASSRLRRKRRIAGVGVCEMLDALETKGIEPLDSEFNLGRDAPTLAQWYKNRGDKRGTYLLVASNHYLVVCGTRITCCQTMQWQPVHERKRHKRARVKVALHLGREG